VGCVTIIPTSSLYLPLVLFAVMQMSALLQMWARPYRSIWLNRAELASLYLLLLNYISALVGQSATAVRGAVPGSDTTWVLALFLANLLFMLVLCFSLIAWTRGMIIARKEHVKAAWARLQTWVAPERSEVRSSVHHDNDNGGDATPPAHGRDEDDAKGEDGASASGGSSGGRGGGEISPPPIFNNDSFSASLPPPHQHANISPNPPRVQFPPLSITPASSPTADARTVAAAAAAGVTADANGKAVSSQLLIPQRDAAAAGSGDNSIDPLRLGRSPSSTNAAVAAVPVLVGSPSSERASVHSISNGSGVTSVSIRRGSEDHDGDDDDDHAAQRSGRSDSAVRRDELKQPLL
jgi:hypothetical protein